MGRIVAAVPGEPDVEETIAPTAHDKRHAHQPDTVRRQLLEAASGRPFYNTSRLDFERLLDDPNLLAQNLNAYTRGFSENVQEIIDRFGFADHIARMDERNLLFEVIKAFAGVDLSPGRVDNMQMGYVFEELIRVGAEQSNEEAGEHFTPREVIRLMVSLLLSPEPDLGKSHVVKTIYDPACGTGGMLSVAEDHLLEHNREARPILYGQDINDEAWAVCKSDMLLKGQDAENIIRGDTFTNDGFHLRPNGQRWTFDYILANPPFGVEWKQQQQHIKQERDTLGYDGRFGAGLPRINDGSLLFLLHMLSKMQPTDGDNGGSRIAIVFNGSPLFTGDAGSGESNIRQWIIENDWLEAIVALPDQMFYNTGISTYIWVLTNRKEPHRVGKVQLIDGRQFFTKMRKSLGNKRHELSPGPDRRPDKPSTATSWMAKPVRPHRPRPGNPPAPYPSSCGQQGVRQQRLRVPEDHGRAALAAELRCLARSGIARLEDEKAFINLAKSKKRAGPQHDAEDSRRQVPAGFGPCSAGRALANELNGEVVGDRDTFLGVPSRTTEQTAGVRLATPERKAVLSALSERDPDAAICKDRNGNPEPDTESTGHRDGATERRHRRHTWKGKCCLMPPMHG